MVSMGHGEFAEGDELVDAFTTLQNQFANRNQNVVSRRTNEFNNPDYLQYIPMATVADESSSAQTAVTVDTKTAKFE